MMNSEFSVAQLRRTSPSFKAQSQHCSTRWTKMA